MKKVIVLFMAVLMLYGCSQNLENEDFLLQQRQQLSERGCQFIAEIHADFGEMTYEFLLDCQFAASGDMHFTVCEPETISGITGTITDAGGKLTFDSTAVAFPVIAEGELTPILAPWLIIKGLRGGYLASWQAQGEGLLITVDDSFQGSPLQLKLTYNENRLLSSGEIVWDGRCILSLQVEDFWYL